MKGLLSKIRIRYHVLKNYRSFKNKTKTNRPIAGASSVFFHLSDVRQEPYYYPIIFSFSEAGYNIFLADNKKFIGHSFGAAKFIFDLPGVIITGDAKDAVLMITDSARFFASGGFKKKILLRLGAFFYKGHDDSFLPYPMHPNAYKNSYFKKFKELRKTVRESRILFSGNTDPVAYNNPIIRDKFKKLNRVEVLDILLKNLKPEHFITIKEKEAVSNIPKPYFNGAVFYLWQWSPSHSLALDIRVENDQWHSFLAKGDFFLCCPGVVIPQSHNAIEAMAVGTIPILQYSEMFHPHLEHRVNCIMYNNEEELVGNMNLCFQMSDIEIMALRKRVIDYYETYLKHDIPFKIIDSLPEGDHELYFYNET